MQYIIRKYNDEVVTTYVGDCEQNVRQVLVDHNIPFDEDEIYCTEEVYQSERDKYELVRVKDLMEAFALKYGHDNSGCRLSYGSDIWFSPEEILKFIGNFADENGMI